MNVSLRTCLSFAAAVLLLVPASPAQTPSPQKIRALTLLGRPLQFVVADKQGIFAKYGLAVENINKANSDEVRLDLAAGKGDIVYLALDNAVAMVELARADAVIIMGGEGSQNELMAQPEIKSIKELRGKTLIVDAVNTAYALQMKKILSASGLEATRDYEMKPYGATPARLIAMREHKEFAGSMLGPPASITAKREGFQSLGSVQDLIGPYQAAGFFSMRPWAKEHRNTLVAFLAACIEAQRWILAPENKAQVSELLAIQYKLEPEAAAQTYESLMTRPGGYAKDALLDQAGFNNVLKLRAEVEGQWGGHPPPPEKYYDPSYYEAALAKLKGAD
jgi:ABC-type nitrate/sulfonate/bicarbonate transport system substrate-binding protein